MQVEKGRLAGWLVAPKIARINIRARHCHSVNFPRCWLYRVRKEERGFARGVAWRGGTRGWTKGKTQISLPPPPSMEFYALRVFNAAAAHVWSAPAFSLRSPPLHPLRVTSTIPIGQHRSRNTYTHCVLWSSVRMHARSRMEKKKGEEK